MASTRQNSLSPSDDHVTRPRVGGASDARGDAAPPPGPSASAVRLAIGSSGKPSATRPSTRLPGCCAEPDTSVWIDATSPTPDQAQRIGRALGLHPLIAEDVLEGNQRAEDRGHRRRRPHRHVRIRYTASVDATEVDFVLGDRFLLTVHDAGWDPRAAHQLRSGVGPASARPGPPALGAGRRHRRRLLPVPDRIGDAIDDVQDEVIEATTRHRSTGCSRSSAT